MIPNCIKRICDDRYGYGIAQKIAGIFFEVSDIVAAPVFSIFGIRGSKLPQLNSDDFRNVKFEQ